MRRLAAALWLLAAACSVPLEGAPCNDSTNCPSGQACGYDMKCSTEAARCTQPACRPGENACASDGTVVSCQRNGTSICGVFPATGSSCNAGQTCGPGALCVDNYAIAITSPVANTVVGPSGVDVIIQVTRASSVVPVADVALDVDGIRTSTTTPSSQQGLLATYTIHFTPAAATQGPVTLRGVAEPGPTEIVSAPVAVIGDDVAPTVSSPVLSCGAHNPCWRDDVMTVTATVSDPYLASVAVTLDLAPGTSVPMALQGASYQGQLALRNWPFPWFLQTVTATVTATDQAGNQRSSSSSIPVSRLRWAVAAETSSPPQLTGAAIDGTGNIAIGGANSKLYLFAPSGSLANAPAPTVGSIGLAGAPSIGPSAIWAPSQDGRIYAVNAAGTSVISSCPGSVTAGNLFTPVLTSGATERAYSGGANRRIYAFDLGTPGVCTSPGSSSVDVVTTSLVLSGGALYAATATGTLTASVRQYTDPGDGALTAGWVAAPSDAGVPCLQVEAPLSTDANGDLLVACGNGQIYRISRGSGIYSKLITLAGKATESIVVRGDGDLLVGTNDNLLHRLTPATPPAFTEKWPTAPDLGAPVTGVALAARDALGVDVYAVTAAGGLYAVDADGTSGGNPAGLVIWSTAGLNPAPLGTASLRFPAIAPARGVSDLPTLYAPSADGKVYAVIVDSGLDPGSPWPKAHRDLANGGRFP